MHLASDADTQKEELPERRRRAADTRKEELSTRRRATRPIFLYHYIPADEIL
jgi:hypothetical protein